MYLCFSIVAVNGISGQKSSHFQAKTQAIFFFIGSLLLVVCVEVEVAHELLGQLPPAALAEDCALGVELHAPLEALLGAAVLADAHVVGRDSCVIALDFIFLATGYWNTVETGY